MFLALNLGPSDSGSFVTTRSDLSSLSRSPHGLPIQDSDRRCASLKRAVKFAKVNNLLGLMIDAEVAIHAPALITTIKESGLVLITHGQINSEREKINTQMVHGVDGIQVDGICTLLHTLSMK